MYVKVGTTYIAKDAVEYLDLANTGNARIEIGMLSGKVFNKSLTHTTYEELKKVLESAVDYDLNGVGL